MWHVNSSVAQQIKDEYQHNNKHMHLHRQLQQDFHGLKFVMGFGNTTVVFIVCYYAFFVMVLNQKLVDCPLQVVREVLPQMDEFNYWWWFCYWVREELTVRMT